MQKKCLNSIYRLLCFNRQTQELAILSCQRRQNLQLRSPVFARAEINQLVEPAHRTKPRHAIITHLSIAEIQGDRPLSMHQVPLDHEKMRLKGALVWTQLLFSFISPLFFFKFLRQHPDSVTHGRLLHSDQTRRRSTTSTHLQTRLPSIG